MGVEAPRLVDMTALWYKGGIGNNGYFSLEMLALVCQLLAVYTFSRIIWTALKKQCNPTTMDNLRGPAPSSFLTGCMEQLHDKNTGWAYHREISAKFGDAMKIKGLFGVDQIYTFDPKAMYHIFVKDQHIYEEPPLFISFFRLAFGEGLLGTLGEQHRKQRKMLNPVFSIAHMRDMVPMFYDITHKLQQLLAKKVENGSQEVDLASYLHRIALELIGQAGIGHSFDTFQENEPTHPYAKAAAGIMPAYYPLRFVAPLLAPFVLKHGNPKFCRFVMDLLPYKALHNIRDIIDIMDQTSWSIYAQKKKALAEEDEALKTKIGEGKDVMSILMRANMSASKDESLSEAELVAQINTLMFAATDTTSNALSRVFHLLAQYPYAQERLRREIAAAKEQNDGKHLPYDALVHLPYLDAVCRETLRLYSPTSLARRKTIQDVILPLSKPVQGVDGKDIFEIPLPKNTEVLVSLMSSNKNPEIWGPDAYEWKPERWLSDLPDALKAARIPGVYSHLMTFIGGGRSCIGFKFSQLEMKVVLCSLVESFRFSPSKHDIIWHMNSIASPTTAGNDSLVPVLPIVVERI